MAVQIEVAPPKERFLAAAIDFVPPFLLFVIFAAAGWTMVASLMVAFGSVYFVVRDLVGNGQSPGKRVMSLQVVDTTTDRVPVPMAMLFRNLGFAVPGLNVVYAIVEGIRVLQHPQGLRFGDAFADTGVVKVPPDEREKLLVPKKDRPSRESKAVSDAPTIPEGDAVAPDAGGGAVPAAPRAESSISGSRQRPKIDRPSGGQPAVPGKDEFLAAASAPVKEPMPLPTGPQKAGAPPPPPKPIDLPPEKDAPLPTPPPSKPAPQGVKMADDDPLKKLIDSATAKK